MHGQLTNTIRIEIPGNPIPKGRPRFGNGRTYTPKRTKTFEDSVGLYARSAMAGELPYDAPMDMRAVFVFEPPKSWSKKKRQAAMDGLVFCTSGGDLDNLQKAVADSLNGIVYVDDRQIISAHVSKAYGPTAGTIVELTPIIVRAA